MRGARRLTIACLAAGLMLGSASASAQDAATTTNTPAAQAVGPRELENFSLQGNVTRAAEEPAQRSSAAPSASTRDDQPASTASTVRQPRERTASAGPAASSPRTTPSPQREPGRKTATAATQPTTTPSDGLLAQPTPTPADADTDTCSGDKLCSAAARLDGHARAAARLLALAVAARSARGRRRRPVPVLAKPFAARPCRWPAGGFLPGSGSQADTVADARGA